MPVTQDHVDGIFTIYIYLFIGREMLYNSVDAMKTSLYSNEQKKNLVVYHENITHNNNIIIELNQIRFYIYII